MAGYEGGLAEHEFYDADHPQHPLALPTGVAFTVVKTVAVDRGYDDVARVNDLGQVVAREARAVTFRHYVRRGDLD